MALTIASLNVRELRDKAKRTEELNWLCIKKFLNLYATRGPLY